VLPAEDLVLFGDVLAPGWSMLPSSNATVDGAVTVGQFSGAAAIGVNARGFVVDLLADPPVDPVGYAALRFAFRPGAVSSGRAAPAFSVSVNKDQRTAVKLLGDAEGSASLDVLLPEWQVVEVPLSSFGDFDPPVSCVRLLGNLTGDFYLDQIALVAASPAPEPTAVAPEPAPVPVGFSLAPAFPNPFNQATTLVWRLTRPQPVELEVFDVLGQRVRTLFGGTLQAGEYRISWDGADGQGRGLATGVYVARLRGVDGALERKVLLLR
jgi:hypothetical protein